MTPEEEDDKYRRMLRPSWFIRFVMDLDMDIILPTIGLLVLICGALLLLATLLPAGDEAKLRARRLLKTQSFTEIQLDDVGLLACGKEDIRSESVQFRALSHNGMRMTGSVCCGWWKNCTIRYE